MPYFDTQGGKCFYRNWQVSQPTAVTVLIHGFGEHSGHYHRLALALNSANIDVWGIDHVGHGLSYGENGFFDSIDELSSNVDVLVELARKKHPNLPLVIIGHSLGGITATNYVLKYADKVQGLVVLGTPFDGLIDLDPSVELIMSKDDFYLDEIDNDPLKFDTNLSLDNLWHKIGEKTNFFQANIPSLNLPVSIINGELDCFATPLIAKKWAQIFKHCKCHIIKEGYHDIPNDISHQEVSQHIISHIKAIV
ncbi:alpha/beta hydrolase [Acinetobacter bereziniae]|uniref:alpha/beta hydrolase n=1 Tax=Acinetobacter bereziniae TaxID=106648 RepID=UPI0030163467